MKRCTSILAAAWMLLAVQAMANPEAPVQEYTLKNGLKLIVKEDHRSPVVVSQVWYKVGSAYEPEGLTGISHVLEHMMFKGTEHHSPGEFSRIVAANGGRENAFTGRDYTAYFQQLEKSRLAVSFELEADRMRNLKILNDEFAKELQVVIEERRLRTDDDPRSKSYEYFSAVAHTNGPYKHPIIGWPDDLNQLTAQDVREWYQRWYAPNNATLVVVGDVQPETVRGLAKQYFESLQPNPELREPKPRAEVPQYGVRRMVMRLPAEVPYLLLGYKTPSLRTATQPQEAYALEVLAALLSEGESSRLPARLVRGKQIAAAADADYDLYARYASLLTIDAVPVAKHSVDRLEAALKQEIEDLKLQPVSAEELERVKAQVLASRIYQRDSMFYQALQIGTLETVGLGWEKVDEYLSGVQAVTPQQVQEVAKKYLTDEHLTVGWLEPQPLNGRKSPALNPAAGGAHVH